MVTNEMNKNCYGRITKNESLQRASSQRARELRKYIYEGGIFFLDTSSTSKPYKAIVIVYAGASSDSTPAWCKVYRMERFGHESWRPNLMRISNVGARFTAYPFQGRHISNCYLRDKKFANTAL